MSNAPVRISSMVPSSLPSWPPGKTVASMAPPERSFNCSAIYSPIWTQAWSPVTTVAIRSWNWPSVYPEPDAVSCFESSPSCFVTASPDWAAVPVSDGLAPLGLEPQAVRPKANAAARIMAVSLFAGPFFLIPVSVL